MCRIELMEPDLPQDITQPQATCYCEQNRITPSILQSNGQDIALLLAQNCHGFYYITGPKAATAIAAQKAGWHKSSQATFCSG